MHTEAIVRFWEFEFLHAYWSYEWHVENVVIIDSGTYYCYIIVVSDNSVKGPSPPREGLQALLSLALLQRDLKLVSAVIKEVCKLALVDRQSLEVVRLVVRARLLQVLQNEITIHFTLHLSTIVPLIDGH